MNGSCYSADGINCYEGGRRSSADGKDCSVIGSCGSVVGMNYSVVGKDCWVVGKDCSVMEKVCSVSGIDCLGGRNHGLAVEVDYEGLNERDFTQ